MPNNTHFQPEKRRSGCFCTALPPPPWCALLIGRTSLFPGSIFVRSGNRGADVFHTSAATISGMKWKANDLPTWGFFVIAALALVLSVVWRVHDKGSTLFSEGWRNSLSIFVPAIVIAAAVLGAAILNYKSHSAPASSSSAGVPGPDMSASVEEPQLESKLKIHSADYATWKGTGSS
jgi:hypothetical protein